MRHTFPGVIKPTTSSAINLRGFDIRDMSKSMRNMIVHLILLNFISRLCLQETRREKEILGDRALSYQ